MFKLLIQPHEHTRRKLWQGLVSLILPIVIWFYWLAVKQQSVLMWRPNQCVLATLIAGAGLIISFVLFLGRSRFWWTFILFFVAQWMGQIILTRWANGEFDFFNLYSAWLIYSSLFGLGWLMGWCLQRFRLGVYFFILGMGLVGLYALREQVQFTSDSFLLNVLPSIVAPAWCLYAYELWRRFNFTSTTFLARFWGRLLLSVLLIGLLLSGVIRYYYHDIESRLFDYEQQTSSNEQLDKKRNGQMANKKNMGLGIKNQRSNNPNPIFCAYIPFTIPNTDIPNPLYMVSYHFNRFDTLTETFERDTLFKYADEFVPSPAQFTFFQTHTDSSVLKTFDDLKATQVLETDVYSVQLSNETFLAPGTAFSVQPFPVDRRFKSQFTSAYKAKSRISLLNSAYWVYNSQDPMLQDFQEQRFSILSKVNGFENIPADFLAYYTAFPANGIYAPIKQLADSLKSGQTTVLDKVLAVRDYYLQRTSDGRPLFTYSDNPGVPGLPGASRLLHFMFESRRGYCAYYAASTVALLRLMGLPARVVTGFMTVDRSDKNKGWYWFYEDQAHAWVQVYFPGYGWMDFDTTVGDEDARDAPKPDGTPPIEPKVPTVVLQGNLVSIDTLNRTMLMQVRDAVVKKNDFHSLNDSILLNVSTTLFWQDSLPIMLKEFKKGQTISAISYSNDGLPNNNVFGWEPFLSKIKKPYVVDEVYCMPEKARNNIATAKRTSPIQKSFTYIWTLVLLFVIFLLCLPRLTYSYYTWQLRRTPQSLYPMYRRLLYLLHMGGHTAHQLSVMKWAQHSIDLQYKVKLSEWLGVYWQEKYSGKPLNSDVFHKALQRGQEIEDTILAQWPKRKKRLMWFSINRYFRYWQTHYFQ